jgi:hypothetical protein
LKPLTASHPRPKSRSTASIRIGRLKQEIERMKAIEAVARKEVEDTQISLTDPDARLMQGTGKATRTVGYNVKCAVDRSGRTQGARRGVLSGGYLFSPRL